MSCLSEPPIKGFNFILTWRHQTSSPVSQLKMTIEYVFNKKKDPSIIHDKDPKKRGESYSRLLNDFIIYIYLPNNFKGLYITYIYSRYLKI
jgi:hypothetical protein